MNSSWQSYPKIYALGHRAVRDLLTYPHVVEEKVDGSQFSFGRFEEVGVMHSEETGVRPFHDIELRIRSKGAVMNPDAPEKMFTKAVESVRERLDLLHIGWTYRCEYLQKPKHNTLAYDRVPTGHLIGFDVSTGDGDWLGPREKEQEFARIGLECVPVVFCREDPAETTLEALRDVLDRRQSILGGQLIEGVVVKPLVPLFGLDAKTLMGKFVSERFKEAHVHAWRESNPTSGDVLERLIHTYGVEARWMKAIQHLREAGQLEDSPRDIGKLLIEIQRDTGQECKEEIMRALWKWAWPHVSRGLTRGFAEFYKNELLREQFETDGHDPSELQIALNQKADQ